MPDLKFRVEAAAAAARAAVPMMNFRIRVMNQGSELVCLAAVGCRIDIEIPRRNHCRQERERVKDMFGESSLWGETPETLLWTSASLMVPAFSRSIVCDLLAPCSFDFNVAATKYFYGLQEEAAPLRFHFSGQVVYEAETGVRSTPLRQEEAHFLLPAGAWSDLMDNYYPSSVWLRLPRETFDRFDRYKRERGIDNWEDVFEDLLPGQQEFVN